MPGRPRGGPTSRLPTILLMVRYPHGHFDTARGPHRHFRSNRQLAVQERRSPHNWIARRGGTNPASQPNFERYGYHVDKPDHVAVTGLDHPKRTFDLTEGLIRRGYSDADIRAILGGNAMRVLSAIRPH
jgi:microsomal dipeptidase-like Zn-dependent dipeptidase